MAVYFARNSFAGKRGELDRRMIADLTALSSYFGQQHLGETVPELDIRKLNNPPNYWRLKCGDWRAGFCRVGQDFTVVLIARRDNFYSQLERRGVAGFGGRVKLVSTAEFVESVDRLPKDSGSTGEQRTFQRNALSSFSGRHLELIKGIGRKTAERISRIPEGVDLLNALEEFVPSADLVALLADMAEHPDRYHRIYDTGGVPSVEAFATEREERFASLDPSDTPEDFVAVETADELEAILDASLQDWMVFLREEQRDLVAASYNGPSRIGGGPGTGKTVVALHRAIHWAQPRGDSTPEPKVLMTTFVKTLPAHWATLLRRMNPQLADSITCNNVDSLAMGIVGSDRRARGMRDDKAKVNMLSDEERESFAERMVKKYSMGSRFADEPSLLLEEFDHFIATRGIPSRDEYLSLERTGAGVALGREQRELVYSAYEEYRDRLVERDRFDWPHLALEALRLAELGKIPKSYAFDSVIVDEAQDLTAVKARLLMTLDTSPDHSRFLLVGDGQQRIYRGGFTLRDVGIEVTGRSRILRGNWRNTYWIWAVAHQLSDGVPVPELEDVDEVRDALRSSEPRREGEPVTLHVVPDEASELDRIFELVSSIAESGHDIGECAVIAWSTDRQEAIISALSSRGVPVMRMTDWAGASLGKLVVGVVHRAKGLEFKQVIVCGMSHSERGHSIDRSKGLADEEAEALEVRLATVAVTRARDTLHLVSAGEPWGRLRASSDLMDVVPE